MFFLMWYPLEREMNLQVSLTKSYWLAAISCFTWSRASRKNLSNSVLWSRMFLARRFTLFISLVFSSITRCSLASSILEASASILYFSMIARFSVLNSRAMWLRECSSVDTFSESCNEIKQYLSYHIISWRYYRVVSWIFQCTFK